MKREDWLTLAIFVVLVWVVYLQYQSHTQGQKLAGISGRVDLKMDTATALWLNEEHEQAVATELDKVWANIPAETEPEPESVIGFQYA